MSSLSFPAVTLLQNDVEFMFLSFCGFFVRAVFLCMFGAGPQGHWEPGYESVRVLGT